MGSYAVAVCYNTRHDNTMQYNTMRRYTQHRIKQRCKYTVDVKCEALNSTDCENGFCLLENYYSFRRNSCLHHRDRWKGCVQLYTAVNNVNSCTHTIIL